MSHVITRHTRATVRHRTPIASLPQRGSATLRDLGLPGGAAPVPGVALSGPFTGIEEQVVALRRMAAAGGFRHARARPPGFGESDGRRGHEGGQGDLSCLRAAGIAGNGRPSWRPGWVSPPTGRRCGRSLDRCDALPRSCRMVAKPRWAATSRTPVTGRSGAGHHAALGAPGAARFAVLAELLVVHGKVDAYCSPDLARELHARAR